MIRQMAASAGDHAKLEQVLFDSVRSTVLRLGGLRLSHVVADKSSLTERRAFFRKTNACSDVGFGYRLDYSGRQKGNELGV